MAKVAKVEGFNPKEQKLLSALSDGEQHDIRELKKLFWEAAKERCKETYEKGWGESEIDSQAQSYVRNSIRRLIRDGWVEGPHMNENLPRGTYKLTTKGKNWVAKGVDTTVSAKEREERRNARKAKTAERRAKAKEKAKKQPKAKKEKKEAKPKAPKAKKPPKAKKQPKAAAPKKAKPKVAAPKKAKPANGAKEKAQAAKAKVSKEAAKEKAQEAARRAAKEATPTGNMTSETPAPATN